MGTTASTPIANQLLNAARSEAQATTAGPLQELAQQIASQNAQNANATKAIGGYFKGLGNYVGQNAGQISQVGQNLTNTLGQLSSTEQGQLQGISNNSAALMNQYIPKGDQSVGDAGMQSLVGNLAAQQGYATQDMAAQQGAAQTGQADFQDLAHALAGADATAGRQDLANVQLAGAAKIAPLASKYAGEVDKQGALTQSNLTKLQQQEATNQYHDELVQLAGGKLAVSQQQANTTAKNDAGKLGIAQQNANTSAERAATAQQTAQSLSAYRQGLLGIDQQKANTAQQNAQSEAAYRDSWIKLKQGTGGRAPLTANENNRLLTALGQAVSASRQLSKTQNPSTIISDLSSGNAQLSLQGGKYRTLSALPRPVVQAALEITQSGSISHQTYLALHSMGMRNLTSLGFKVAAPTK